MGSFQSTTGWYCCHITSVNNVVISQCRVDICTLYWSQTLRNHRHFKKYLKFFQVTRGGQILDFSLLSHLQIYLHTGQGWCLNNISICPNIYLRSAGLYSDFKAPHPPPSQNPPDRVKGETWSSNCPVSLFAAQLPRQQLVVIPVNINQAVPLQVRDHGRGIADASSLMP